MEERAGTMWTWRAEGGSSGRSSSASCVETMREPLGFRIVIGVVAGRLLMTGAVIVQKWAVLPVSAMAGQLVEGGPKLDDEWKTDVI